MARTIKFRAWDVRQKKMILLKVITCHSDELKPPSGVFYEPMQFTGLLDKNGNEIFEGDIVRVIRKDGCYGGEDIERIDVVEEPTYHILEDFQTGGPDGIDEVISREVLGNIYENKELLK